LLSAEDLLPRWLRRNLVQPWQERFSASAKPAVSRRWDLLRSAIKKAVAGFVPAPRDVLGTGAL
jgi:hypothetical protein